MSQLGRIRKIVTRINRRTYLRVGAAVTAALIVAFGAWSIVYLRQPAKAVYNLQNLGINAPIRVSFTRPVQDHLNYNLSPEPQGTWKVSHNLIGVTAVTFYPTHPFTPGSSMKLIIGHVIPVAQAAPSITSQTMMVTVERPAAVAAILPAANATNVAVGTDIRLRLKSPNHNLRMLRLETDASIQSAVPTTTDETTFVWKLSQPLQQGQDYHLTFKDIRQKDAVKQVVLTSTFTAVPEPQVSGTNRDHFFPGDTVTVSFNQDMLPATNIFKFNFGGNGHWQDVRTYSFVPSGLQPGQSYTYTVLKGATSTHGGVSESDHTFAISPPGAVYVTASSPGGGAVAVSSAVSFGFDQPVDHATAQAAFSLTPAANGSFSWSGNTMTFHPSGLGYQTGYSATLAPGVKGTYGLPSVRSFTNSFTTTYQVIKLNVPYYHQAYALSCESAALRMSLAYRGINVNDFDILQRLGYNPRPRDTGSNTWDNPYQMFVGDVNGVQSVTGWGVYGPPIASASQSLGRNASYVGGISVNQIADAVHNNNPVIVWGFSGSTIKQDSWNTTSGVVQAPKNEHARTVYGVAGSAANPIGFYMHDPFYGDLYWTTAQLQWNMSFAGTQASQGVIVY